MLQQADRFRKQVGNGQVAWGTFLAELEATGVVRMMANAGVDFLIIDTEHGSYSIEQVRRLLEAANSAAITAFVRVPGGQRGPITKILDCGADGILFPQIRTMSEVRQTVEMTKYPPLGQRGVHLLRPHTGFDPPADDTEYYRRANATVITAIQIETPEAVELADEIAATEGVDMLYVGPGDLGALFGVRGGDTHPRVIEAIKHVGRACQEHNKLAGCHISRVEFATLRRQEGYTVFGHTAASELFINGVKAFVARAAATGNEIPD